MYKKQMKIQKLVCLLAVVAAAVTFAYSLGVITDIYDSLYSTMRNPHDLTQTSVPGSYIYYDMQAFNKQFLNMSIVLILLGALLFATNTHTRRKYYIANYAATALYSVAALGVTIWSHLQIETFKVQFLTTVDFEAMKKFSELWKTPYIDNTFWFDLHYVVLALSIVAVAALIGNLVWKTMLMRQEDQLLAAGKEAAV